MLRSRLTWAAVLAAILLGLVMGFAAARSPAADAAIPRRTAPGTLESQPRSPASGLARLGLSATQREALDGLALGERRRVDGLLRSFAATERELRLAELALPFDAARVNELVAHRAELVAYLRGTESRLVSKIVRLLTRDQRRIFAELRLSGASTASGVSLDPAALELRARRLRS
jgi:Spy/CpxP family protein refolding chaperone